MNRTTSLVLASALLLLAACGGESVSVATNPLAGVYKVDLAKTAAARGQALMLGASRTKAVLEQRLGPDAYVLDLRPNATFVLRIDSGQQAFTVQGTWTPTDAGIELTTTVADGQPASGDEEKTSTLRAEGEWLVVETPDRPPTYLRRV